MKVLLMLILVVVVVVVLGNRQRHEKKFKLFSKKPVTSEGKYNSICEELGKQDHLPQHSEWIYNPIYKKPENLHPPQEWKYNRIYKKPGKRNNLHREEDWNDNPIYVAPNRFDARTNFTNCPSINNTSDQGNTKSSWALAVTDMMNDRICIQSKGSDKFKYSYHNLLSCCKECGNLIDGGDTEKALKYFQCEGVVSEECQYFKGLLIYQRHFEKKENPKCYKKCTYKHLDYENDKRRSFGFQRILTNEDIMMEIKDNGPVVADMEFYKNFKANKRNEVYKRKFGAMTHRSVRLLGWGETHDDPYWLVATSEGVIKILRGSDFCGIESKVYAGYPNAPSYG